MIIQLKTGRIIHLTLDQYLDMSDEEFEFLNNPAYNIGNHPGSIWEGSQIERKRKKVEEGEEIDRSVDYSEEDEDIFYEEPLPGLTIINESDFPITEELPDDLVKD